MVVLCKISSKINASIQISMFFFVKHLTVMTLNEPFLYVTAIIGLKLQKKCL
jgi:hypothetical protein